MDNNENYNNKIENLINAFSELTDEDIEEAKAVIRAAGKNPEEVLERGLKRLQNVKEKIRRARKSSLKGWQLNYSFPVFIYDEVENVIKITDHQDLHKLLTLREIYEVLMAGEGLKNSPLENSKIAPEVKNWRFQRLSKELVFEINILPEFVEVKALLKVAEKFELTLDAVETAIQTGYYNAEGRCYPIDSESLDFAREFLGWLDDDKHLSVYKALNLYSSKSDWRLLKFTQEQFDLQVILNSGSFQTTNTLFTQELYDYQEDGLRWLLHRVINRLGGILADDMGLGKTAQIIALIANVLERNLLERILIVVPSTLLENWRREFLFFAPQIVPYIHHGFGRSGSPALLRKHQVIITSYSIIINDEFLFNKIQWGLTILDEASLIKNPESERRIALKGLDSIVKIAMTGTPVENSLIDLWSIADYVCPGYLGTKAEFTTKYISRDIVQTLDSGNLTDLRNYISFIMLRRKKEDVLESLPEKIDIHQALTMHEAEAILYEAKRNEILKDSYNNGGAQILKLITELRMYTTHPLLRTPEDLASATLAELRDQSFKFTRMMELLREISLRKEKVIIFTEYLDMIDTLQRVLSKLYNLEVFTIDGRVDTIERQRNIDRFSTKDGFDILVLNPKTAGMGLNITAANHVIHYTRQWNPALEQQASARAYRNGQKKSVNIYYLYYADTIEEVIDERLRSKTSLSDEVIAVTEAENMEEYLYALSKSPIK